MSSDTHETGQWLRATAAIDVGQPALRQAVRRIVGDATVDTTRAVRIHDFVRDRVAFGWVSAFDRQTASQTLSSGIGFCNTKTPLFVALLRAAGIPARLHFVGIDKHILDGLIDPRDRYVDHSFAEVLLGGRWLKVDSYIVDLPLHRAALKKLRSSGKVIGFGVHARGTASWDGHTDSFAQFLDDGSSPDFSDVDFGVFEDVPSFYASGRARTPTNPLFRHAVLRPLLWLGNRNVRALRAQAGAVA
jgi:hypothetical protein